MQIKRRLADPAQRMVAKSAAMKPQLFHISNDRIHIIIKKDGLGLETTFLAYVGTDMKSKLTL